VIKEIADTTVDNVEGREPAKVRPTATLDEVVAVMAEQRRGAALVEDESGKIMGIFTERDLMNRLDHSNHDWRKLTVDQVMRKNTILVEGDQTIREALKTMLKGRIRHLPIIDSNKNIRGIVSIRGILVHMVSYFATELLNLPPDTDHEASKQWGG
jgi:CBS domain-containing protein